MSETKAEEIARWIKDGQDHGWVMPSAIWWKRLPIIRRFRAAWGRYRADQFHEHFAALGMFRSGYDEWVLFGMWHGFERPICFSSDQSRGPDHD